jgi:hypothetical protein
MPVILGTIGSFSETHRARTEVPLPELNKLVASVEEKNAVIHCPVALANMFPESLVACEAL